MTMPLDHSIDSPSRPLGQAPSFHPRHKAVLRDRLYRFIVVGMPDACWPWTGVKTKAGYGVVRFTAGRACQWTTSAHRCAWEVENGVYAPKGSVIIHSCDNPSCCNPRHLSLGTPQDNMRDCIAKGRHRSANGPYPFAPRKRKLSDDDVRAIRGLAMTGKRAWEIGPLFNISESHAAAIVARTRKAHVKDPE